MAKQRIIAQKFGGTSVATPESRRLVVGHIRRTIEEGYSPVVVVSAMGRRGAPYATDTLIELIRAEGEPVHGRDEDLIFHTGEIISTAIMSHLLKLAGFRAVGLTGGQAGIYTDGRPRRAKIVRIDPSRMLQLVENGEIPVVTGGQGVALDGGHVTILGRGASDTSGVAVGVAVGAEKAEIYTDVPGIAIADPRVVPQAQFLKEISYDKMVEMGIYGARVMHPGAVLVGQRGGVPVVCRSTFIEGPGTVITDTRNEPPLVGIPGWGPVELLRVRGAPPRSLEKEDVYDQFAAVAMKTENEGERVVAVAPDWRKPLEDAFTSQGADVQEFATSKALVSLVGDPAIIAETFDRVGSLLDELGIGGIFRERSDIRSTFAVANEEAPRLVRALYETFVS
jgi:aspartate kinase